VNKPTWASFRHLGLGGRAALAAALLLLLYAALAPWAYWHSGLAGLLAEGVAAATCLIGALAALFFSDRFRGPSRALQGLALAMAARTGLPLLVLVAFLFCGRSLVASGVVYYVVIFYLAALGIEVPLSLGDTRPRNPHACNNTQAPMTND
jgi:hypothetical protein